ncbi:gastrin-releasing peptide [Arapaima gigas]
MRTGIFVWRCTPGVFVLVLAISKVHVASCSNAGSLDKMFPKGNHWAVGHLMGKKSTNILYGSEKAGKTDSQYLPAPKETKQLEKQLQSSQLFRSLIMALVKMKTPNEARKKWKTTEEGKSYWEENEKDSTWREAGDLLVQSLLVKDNSTT